MKKLVLALAAFGILCSSPIIAAENAPLGSSNIAVKVDHIQFTTAIAEDLGIDTAVYVGVDAYILVAPSIYIGGEVGYAKSENNDFFGDSVSIQFIPVEGNIKYVTALNSGVSLGIGAGLAYISVEETLVLSGITYSDNVGLFGGQVFAEANYTTGQFFSGVNFKYQTTEEAGVGTDTYDYGNWRLGGQVGIKF